MKTKPTLGRNPSALLKSLVCGALVLAAAPLQAQLLKNIHFSSEEGYTTGPLWGQPSKAAEVWAPVDPNHNSGVSLYYENQMWYQEYVTNGMLCVASDGYQGTNVTSSVTYFALPFPVQLKGPITVTWDWRFAPTNVVPSDYDPTNNAYVPGYAPDGQPFARLPDDSWLQETDCGFTLADSANRMADGDPDTVFGELSSITRLGGDHVADSRYNGIGVCGGGGNWKKVGPYYQDGKWLHEKMIAYVGLEGDASISNNTFSVWAQRDGEDIWQTAFASGGAEFGFEDFGMRRCPGEINPSSGINCITMWMNDSAVKFGTRVFVDNIVVLGPIPVLGIERFGAKVKITFTGTLQSAFSLDGPYTDTATSDFMKPLTTVELPVTASRMFYRSVYHNN